MSAWRAGSSGAALPASLVAAWGLQFAIDAAAGAHLEQFIARYAQDPQTPKPGAPCVGGVGAPIER
jgi:hypothetical protein